MTGKQIRYKVVRANRKSIIVPEGSKFSLTYTKGKIVKSIDTSIGIMVFNTYSSAKSFSEYCVVPNSFIIRIKIIGRSKPVPAQIAFLIHYEASKATSSINKFNKLSQKIKHYSALKRYNFFIKHQETIRCPKNTECYNAVEVLD